MLFTTKSYGVCFVDRGWRTVRRRCLERWNFDSHFLGKWKGDVGVTVPYGSRWFRVDVDNHHRGVRNDPLFLKKVVTIHEQLLKYGAPEVDGVPATWFLEIKRNLKGAHFDFFFHRPLFTTLVYTPIPGRTKGVEMNCGNELLRYFLEATDDTFQTNVFSKLELPVSRSNCRLPFGRDYQLILDDVYDQHTYLCFDEWYQGRRGHLSTEDLLRYSVLSDISSILPRDHNDLSNSLPLVAVSESGGNIYMSSTDFIAISELSSEPCSSGDPEKTWSVRIKDKKDEKCIGKDEKSGRMWGDLTSFWDGDLPTKQYKDENSKVKVLQKVCETYKILRFEKEDHDETVRILLDLLNGLPKKCKKSDFFKGKEPERKEKIENVIHQTERWLTLHPEAVANLEVSQRRFAETGRYISDKKTWVYDYHADYSKYTVRQVPEEVIEHVRGLHVYEGNKCRYFPEELAEKIPELVSYLCNIAEARGSKNEATGLELVIKLIGREFGVRIHKSFASQLVSHLLEEGYLVLLKRHAPKVRGRTLGVGEAFTSLPSR